jgi:hypothetical protein
MKQVTVVAIQDFQFSGIDCAPGSLLSCRPVDALILRRKGLVKISKGLTPRVDAFMEQVEVAALKAAETDPEPEPTPTRRRRGAYRRRDMRPDAA